MSSVWLLTCWPEPRGEQEGRAEHAEELGRVFIGQGEGELGRGRAAFKGAVVTASPTLLQQDNGEDRDDGEGVAAVLVA